MKQDKKNNAFVSVKEYVNKKGKIYNNLIVKVTLTNGKIVEFEASQKFYNAKFNYLLVNNLPKEDK